MALMFVVIPVTSVVVRDVRIGIDRIPVDEVVVDRQLAHGASSDRLVVMVVPCIHLPPDWNVKA
jgi:hypothetical protein